MAADLSAAAYDVAMGLLDGLGKMEVDIDVGLQLMNDYESGAELLNADPENQFLRRNLVRTAYAAVEGINNFLKRSIYDHHERNIRPTYHAAQVLGLPPMHKMFEQVQSDSELLLLLEHAPTLEKDGNVRLKEAFQPMVTSIRFMFKMAKAIFCYEFAPTFSDHRWHDLQTGIKIRNRLTHPKASSDLIVEADELKVIERGVQWYLDNSAAMMRAEMKEVMGLHESVGEYLRSLPKAKFLALMECNGGWGDEGPPPGFDDLKFPLQEHYPTS